MLALTPDPKGGTLLDSTVVVWCKELGDARLHDCKSVPFVLTGGGYFKTGRYLTRVSPFLWGVGGPRSSN